MSFADKLPSVDKPFYFGVEIDGQPDWEAGLIHLRSIDPQRLKETYRAVFNLNHPLVPDMDKVSGREPQDVLIMVMLDLIELSKYMQREYDAGERRFGWGCSPTNSPAISGGIEGRRAFLFMMLDVLQAAGFQKFIDED